MHPYLNSLFRFYLQGAIVLLLHLGTVYLLHEMGGLAANYAFLLSLILMFAVNFWGLRAFVFRHRHRESIIWQLSKLLLMSLCFRVVEYLAFQQLILLQPHAYLAVAFVVLLSSSLMKFSVLRSYVFRAATG